MKQKTPMQEHIEWLKSERDKYDKKLKDSGSIWYLPILELLEKCISNAESMLEKEKEVMCEFAEEYVGSCLIDYPKIEVIFNQTFKTKE